MLFLFLHENIWCGSHWGASNEYPQHMFSWRNKQYIYIIPMIPTLIKICAKGIKYVDQDQIVCYKQFDHGLSPF